MQEAHFNAALRALLSDSPTEQTTTALAPADTDASWPHLHQLADELAGNGKGLIMVMGKGGAGKTTIAAALALALVQRGHAVHLSTTDPAAHLAVTLQDDLRRAQIEPFAWVVNKSILAAGTHDPLLKARLNGERAQMDRINRGLSPRCYVVPWLINAPVGIEGLKNVLL